MAHFRATVQGNRSEGSKLGTKSSGIRTTANAWDSGIKVYGQGTAKGNEFHVYANGGSNGRRRDYLLCSLVEQDGNLVVEYFAPNTGETACKVNLV